MTKEWSDFVNLVQVSVPGCPPASVRDAIKRSVNELCMRSALWQERLPVASLFADIDEVPLTPTSDARVSGILSAKYGNAPLTHAGPSRLDEIFPEWENTTQGPPSFCYLYDYDGYQVMKIVPTPEEDEDDCINIRVSLKPKSDAESIPDFFYDDWRDVIAAGALAELCAIPEKTWTSDKLVEYYASKFRAGIARAGAVDVLNGARRSTYVKPVEFGQNGY